MANVLWTGAASSAWSTAGNWSDGAVPDGSDTPRILEGVHEIVSVPTATNGVDYTGFEVGSMFRGKLATAASPLYLGSIGQVDYNGERCREAFISIDTGDAVTLFNVRGSGEGIYALYLGGAGTITSLDVYAGKVRIATGLTVSKLRILGPAHVVIESGPTITAVDQSAGLVENYAEVGTLDQSGGVFDHVGTTTFNMTTVNLRGGVFNFGSSGGTLTTVNLLKNGVLNLDAGVGHSSRVITNLYQRGGTRIIGGRGSNVTITNDYPYGGVTDYMGTPSQN